MTSNAKAFDRQGLITYLEDLLSDVRSGRVDPVSFGHTDETRAVPALNDAALTTLRSGDRHHRVHVRDPRQIEVLAEARQVYVAGGGRSPHMFDSDPSEFGPSRGIMPLDHPRFDVWASGAAHVLKKHLEDVTEHERHRFRMAYLSAFSVMSPEAHDDMAVLRREGEQHASPAQCDGASAWASPRP